MIHYLWFLELKYEDGEDITLQIGKQYKVTHALFHQHAKVLCLVLIHLNLKIDAGHQPMFVATQEADAGESEIQGQLCSLYSVVLSQER